MKKNIYTITIIVLITDQFMKILVEKFLIIPIKILGNFFALEKVHNTGGAWGIFSDSTLVLAFISAIAVILLNQYISRENKFSKQSIIGYGLIMAGILGNFIDRIVYKYVIDFLSFKFFNYSFPVFNIADVAIVVGILLLVIDVIKEEYYEYRNRSRKC